MPSTVVAFDYHYLDSRGEKTSLAGATAYYRVPPYSSDAGSVTINASSQFPTTSVSPAAGTVVRIRIENDGFGRAGYVERTSE